MPVARSGVTMERAAQILLLDQARQRMFFRGFELAAIFPHLRRNEIKIESAIELCFITHFWNLRRRLLLFLGFRIWRQRRETVFVQSPAALQRAAAQLDVVFLVPGEIS